MSARKFIYSMTVADGIVTDVSNDTLASTDLPVTGVTAQTITVGSYDLSIDVYGRVTAIGPATPPPSPPPA